jgi:hypothetical protein
MNQAAIVEKDLLPKAFQDTFIQLAQKLRSEINVFLNVRQEGRNTKADKTLRKSYDELSAQAREKRISFGYAINLLVDAVFTHMATTKKVNINDLRPLRNGAEQYDIDMKSASRLRVSDARLYRAVNWFLDQERRAWALNCPDVSTLVERDLSALRREFISEMHEDGYVTYETRGEDQRVKVTQALIDNFYSIQELRADDTPLAGNYEKIFKKG